MVAGIYPSQNVAPFSLSILIFLFNFCSNANLMLKLPSSQERREEKIITGGRTSVTDHYITRDSALV